MSGDRTATARSNRPLIFDRRFGRRSMSLPEAGAVLCASFFINVLSIAAPLTALLVYDRVLMNQSRSTLAILAAGAVVLILVELALRYIRTLIISRASAHMDFIGRNKVMSWVLSGSEPGRRRPPLAELNAALSAVSALREFRYARLTAIIDMPFGLIFLVLVGFIGGAAVALPIGVCIIFALALAIVAAKNAFALQDLQSEDRLRWRFVERTARALRSVAVIAAQVPLTDKFLLHQFARSAAQLRHGFLTMLNRDLLTIFAQLLIGSVIVTGALAVLDSRLSLGGLAACTLLAGRALEPLQNCFHLMSLSRRARLARIELEGLATVALPEPELNWTHPPEIRFDQVRLLHIDGHQQVIIPKLSIKAGEIVAISGDRGSGKTALALAMLGLENFQGDLRVGGIDPGSIEAAAIRQQSGHIPRSPRLPSGRLLDILTDGSESRYTDVRYLARLMGLDEAIRRLPLGYDTVLRSDGTSNLPEGLRQQIAICHILAKKRRLLIIDDAQATLDAATVLHFARVLKTLGGATTIVMMTNHPSLCEIADRQFQISEEHLVPVPRPRKVA